jgi:uncharacterized repeat protein (TIGR03943 family)
MRKTSLQVFALTLFGLAALRLYRQGRLITYIHPSTLWMVVLAGSILLLIALALLAKRPDHSHATKFQLGMVLFVALIMAVSKTVPLSASLAMQRETGSRPLASRSTLTVHGLSKNYSVLDWLAAWDSDPTHQKYLDSQADVIGFITKDGGHYAVTRLLITCCVVDAQPVQLDFGFAGQLPAQGTWVEVKGAMSANGSAPLLEASSVKQVVAPEQQYVY